MINSAITPATALPATAQLPRKPSYLKKILVIDDEPLFTELVRVTLDRRGEYLTKVVNDSVEALDTARDFLPDAILLDVVMPDLDGGEVSALLEADPILQRCLRKALPSAEAPLPAPAGPPPHRCRSRLQRCIPHLRRLPRLLP